MRHLDEFSREELYDLVWSDAMATLAPKYGISDVALKKRCNRLGIPTPGRGYWAKVEAGQSPKRSKLPADIPVRPKYKRKTFPDSLVYFEVEGADYSSRRPHQVTVATRRNLRDQYPSYNGLFRTGYDAANLEVSKPSSQRALWTLDQLLKAGERLGLVVAFKPGHHPSVLFTLGREGAEIAIKEKLRRFDNPNYDPKAKFGPLDRREVHVYKPCGLLRVKVKFTYGPEREWMDSPATPVDGQIESIVQAIRVGLEESAVRREAIRQAEIRHEQERRAEWERQRLREEEEERRRDLEKLAKSLAASERVLFLANAVERALMEHQVDTTAPPIVEWLQWAREHGKRLNPVTRVTKELLEKLEATRLDHD